MKRQIYCSYTVTVGTLLIISIAISLLVIFVLLTMEPNTALGYPAPHEGSYPGPYPGPPADFLPVIVRDIVIPTPDGGTP